MSQDEELIPVRFGPGHNDFEQLTESQIDANDEITECTNSSRASHEANLAYIDQDGYCPLCDPEYDEYDRDNKDGAFDNMDN